MPIKFIDKMHARKNSKLVLLAFDCVKAFDSIVPKPMLVAPERFGLPADFLAMMKCHL